MSRWFSRFTPLRFSIIKSDLIQEDIDNLQEILLSETSRQTDFIKQLIPIFKSIFTAIFKNFYSDKKYDLIRLGDEIALLNKEYKSENLLLKVNLTDDNIDEIYKSAISQTEVSHFKKIRDSLARVN